MDELTTAAARRRLLETRLYQAVRVATDTRDDGTATVTFELEEKPRYVLGAGLRWESEGGGGALFDVVDRNHAGRGISLGLRTLWAEQQRTVRLYGQIPKVLGTSATAELFAEVFVDEREEQLEKDGWEISGQITFPVAPRLQGRVYGRYRSFERTDLAIDPAGRSPLAISQERTPLLGTQLVYDLRDDVLRPSRGLLASVDLSGSREQVGDANDYLRAFGQLSLFHHLRGFANDRVLWAHSYRVGLSEGELSEDVRFFAGGQYSIRGYGARSLGPRLQLDDGSFRALGGEALLVLNQELRFRVMEGLEGVVFFDAGNVWGSRDDFGDDLRRGVGLGVRFDSPVGLLRFDVGHPLDRREDDDEYQFYLGFGHAF